MDPFPPAHDGWVIPEVGWWSREKHHFLARYLDAFTTSMKAKGWDSLEYIDLFAGAGIEKAEHSGELGWGSPLIAAQAKHPFAKLHLCERDKAKRDALEHRLRAICPNCNFQLWPGDANERVGEIVAGIPSGSLCLAFLDPYGLHVDFESLRALSARRADLIIFFPVELDAIRNMRKYYWDDPDSRLDLVMGPNSNWREEIRKTPARRAPQKLIELYVRQIKALGYEHCTYEPVPSSKPLYRLIFCSKSDAGLKIWRGISSIKPGGQRTLFG